MPLTDDVRKQIEDVVVKNNAKIAEYEKHGIKPGGQVAALVEHLKLQNVFFRKMLNSRS